MEPVAISRDLRDTNTFIPTEAWEVPGPSGLFPAEQVIALGGSFAKEIFNGYNEKVAERVLENWLGIFHETSWPCLSKCDSILV
jgi:hypothetical protein